MDRNSRLLSAGQPLDHTGADATPTPTEGTTVSRTLLAFFSRAGENYYYGGRKDLQVGNTEVLARMISELIDCEEHRIEAADPYPASYDATVRRPRRHRPRHQSHPGRA